MPRRVSGLLLALLAAPVAVGEERFYPIVGPDGRMEMIRSEARPAEKTEAAEKAATTGKPASETERQPARPVAGKSPAAAATANSAAANAGAEAETAGNAAAATGKPQLPHAAYDSDEYVDSEAVESAAAPAGDKKRFYLVDDGMGARVSESAGGQEGDFVPPPAAPVAVELEKWLPLAAARRSWTPAEAARDMPWLPACAPAAMLEQAAPLAGGEPAGQVVAAPDYAFLPPNRVLGAYRMSGEGPRTLVMRSYTRKDRQPAFLHPRLAFLDGKGCLTRVTHGYFERIYPATDRRHAYLRADLVVHTGEEWLLLLAPTDNDKAAAALPWRESGFGQLKFTLKK